MKKGVMACTNHEPKVRLGRWLTVIPPSERRSLREALHRLRVSNRMKAGTRPKRCNGPFDHRKPLSPVQQRYLRVERLRALAAMGIVHVAD